MEKMMEVLIEMVTAVEDERHAVEEMSKHIQARNEFMTDMWEKKMDKATKRLDKAMEDAKLLIKETPSTINLMVN